MVVEYTVYYIYIVYIYIVHCSVLKQVHWSTFVQTWTPPFLRKSPFVVDGVRKNAPQLAYHVSLFLLLQYNVCEHNIILHHIKSIVGKLVR